MVTEKSFFTFLIGSKPFSEREIENKSDIKNDFKEIANDKDNEWLQEYELIYRAYTLES